VKSLKGHTPDIIETAYNEICKTVIKQINGILYFGGNELVVIGKNFVIKEIGTVVIVEAPVVKFISRTYISDIS